MKFVAHARYAVSRPEIERTLPEHTAYAESLVANGRIAAAGPYRDEQGRIVGVHFVYDACSSVEAEGFLRDDPFHRLGLFEPCAIKAWNLLGCDRTLLDAVRRRETADDEDATGRPRARAFLVSMRYVADPARLAAVRPRHRDYAQALRARGELVMGGPFADDSGGLLVYSAVSRESAARLLAHDPFAIEGVIADSELAEWEVRGANAALFA